MAWVIFREPQMSNYLDSPRGEVGRYLLERGRRIELAAKQQVPTRTGLLRASIHTRHFQDPRSQFIMVGSDHPRAFMVHEGTRPHIIAPKRSHILRFSSRGRTTYTNVVMHPGTKPNRYLSDNLRLIR